MEVYRGQVNCSRPHRQRKLWSPDVILLSVQSPVTQTLDAQSPVPPPLVCLHTVCIFCSSILNSVFPSTWASCLLLRTFGSYFHKCSPQVLQCWPFALALTGIGFKRALSSLSLWFLCISTFILVWRKSQSVIEWGSSDRLFRTAVNIFL